MDEDFEEDIPERFRPLLKPAAGEVELRNKLYPDVSVIEDAKIQCTICLTNVKHVFLLKKKSYKHIFLQVVVCKACMKFYGDGDFSAEEDGDDKYCRWCGQGGKLYLCSKCPTAFCKKCIKQNLERKYVLRVEDDDWLCFVCDPKPLFKLRALSWAIDQHFENEKKKEEDAKNRKLQTPRTPKSRTFKIPNIEFSDEQFRPNVESTRKWLLEVIEKRDQLTSVKDSKRIRIDADRMSSVSSLESVVSSLIASADAQIGALMDLKEQVAVGVKKLIEKVGDGGASKKASKSHKKKVDVKKNTADSNDSTSTTKNKKSAQLDDSDDCSVSKKNASRRLTSAFDDDSNDSNSASSSKDKSVKAQKTDSEVSDGIYSTETVDGTMTNGDSNLNHSCVDMFEDQKESKPLIRLRNMSDLIDPKLKLQKTPEKGKSKAKVQEKRKPWQEPEEITLISSDDDEPPRKLDAKKKSQTEKSVETSKKAAPSKDLAKGSKKKPNGTLVTSTPKALASKVNGKSDLSDDEVKVPNPKAKKLSLTTKDSKRTKETESENDAASSETSKNTEGEKSDNDSAHSRPASPGPATCEAAKKGADDAKGSSKAKKTASKQEEKEVSSNPLSAGSSDEAKKKSLGKKAASKSSKAADDGKKEKKPAETATKDSKLMKEMESESDTASSKTSKKTEGGKSDDDSRSASPGPASAASEKSDSDSTLASKKQPAFFLSSDNGSGLSEDEETEKPASKSSKAADDGKKKKKSAETAKKGTDDDKGSSKAKKTAPKQQENKVSSSSASSSSSDPLSAGSSDEAKKKKSAAKSDSDGSSKPKNRKKIRRSKKTTVLSDSDSDDDGKELLRKKRTVKKEKTSKPNDEKKKKSSKKRSRGDGSSSDCDIRRLCDLRSLQAKATSSDSSDDEEGKKTSHKAKKRKTKDAEEKLSDFFDSADDQLAEGEGEEDLKSIFEREFSHVLDADATHDDIRAEMLKMSSQSEGEGKSSSDEEEEPVAAKKSKKANPDKPKSKKENSTKSKGKKQYPDKLMKMKVDSTDSEDVEAGQEKYDKHKQKQALKKEESSDDEAPVVKKKPAPKGKKAVKKKMFSDSDESPIDDESSEKEPDKAESEEAGSDDDDDDKKRKKSTSDSDSSDSAAAKKKKRRRIKAATESESETDSDGGRRRKKKDPNESSKGRKSIRKILKEDDLKRTTQEALKAEQERKRRIKEKQELYNKMVAKATEKEAPKELSELVLDFDPKTKEKILCVDKDLVKKLKPHQGEGIKFMWDSCFETVKMTKKKTGSGCILAHCMGLGKSLQVVTLVHTLITNPDTGVRKVLIVAPLSTVLNWVNEFDKWLSDIGTGQDVNVFHMNKVQTAHRTYLLKDWDRNGGVLIMGYNLLRNLSNAKARFKASAKKVFQENLVDPGPDVVICDEGHILKNEKTAVNQCMTQIKTRRRIVLTGTPLQNNLVEYHCMVQFVKPNLLGTKKEFTNRFVNPIQNGQFEDSTQHDVKVMKRRAHVLHTMLDGIVQRKDYSVLTPYLPPKYEYVIHLKLSDVQVKLYRYYLLHMVHQGNADAAAENTAPKGRRLFVDFQNLMWICLHPRTLLMKADKDEIKKAMMDDSDEEGSLKDFIDDDKSTSESDFKTSGSSDDGSGSEASVKSAEVKNGRRGRRTRAGGSASEPEEDPTPVKQWWSDLIEEADMNSIFASSKLFLFFTILKYCEEIGDKLLLFSQSLYTLDILEYFLDKIDTETQKPEEDRCPGIKGFEGSWAKGLDYFRLDGSSACENREAWCKSFNRPDNTRARLFLISTRAGGLGINLTGANRVIIFDASWNPSFDVQSLFRVYRFGQEKPCYIYRFLSKGTMEEKIYERQVAKLSTSLRVIDEQQIDRHFSHSALNELYMFDPEGSELQGTPALPKDRLMAELLQSHKEIILSHHQHDSLLENQEDQELSEEERKAAWQEFENEKNQKPPPPTFTINAMANLMVEIRTKLQIQNPTWTDEQLRVGAFQLMQRLPDFQQMAPYINFMQLQQQAQQQQFAQRAQYPGMQFPAFRYPLYQNNMAVGNNMAGKTMGVGTNMGVGTSMGIGTNMGVGANMGVGNNMGVGVNMAAGNMGLMSQLLNNAGAGTSAANPGIASLLTSMAGNAMLASANKLAPNPKHAQKTTGAGTSTDPIELNDSGPFEIE